MALLGLRIPRDLRAVVENVGDKVRRRVHLNTIEVPVLVVAGTDDTLAPEPAVVHLLDLVTGAPRTQIVRAPGGHLGVLTGRGARTASWPGMETFFTESD